jgi:putative transcriptional regulator
MIKCHLSRILGERRLKVADLVRATGINRKTLDRIYSEEVTRIEFDTLEAICKYLDIGIAELYEIVE